jgi:hypothetical protein
MPHLSNFSTWPTWRVPAEAALPTLATSKSCRSPVSSCDVVWLAMGWPFPLCPAVVELDVADMLDIEDTDSARCMGTSGPDPSVYKTMRHDLVTYRNITLHYTTLYTTQSEIWKLRRFLIMMYRKPMLPWAVLWNSGNKVCKSNRQNLVQQFKNHHMYVFSRSISLTEETQKCRRGKGQSNGACPYVHYQH